MQGRSEAVKECSGLAEICGQYDVFILDQWGVLHDGRSSFPQALDAVRFLKDCGKSVAVVTNSGKSAHSNIARLSRMGYKPEWFDAVVTSGDLALETILREYPVARAYWIDYSFDPESEKRLVRADSADDADVIYLSGWSTSVLDWQQVQPKLADAAARRIPMICGNPDVDILEAGKNATGAGWVAEQYRQMGGEVRSFGKPDREIFRRALELAGNHAAARAVMIGDSFFMDIRGAQSAGLSTILITQGIHAELFRSRGTAAALAELGEISPDYIMSALKV